MSDKFAKLFDIGDYQLLLTVDEHEDGEHDIICARASFNGIDIAVRMDGGPEMDCAKYLSEMDESKAATLLGKLHESVESVRAKDETNG